MQVATRYVSALFDVATAASALESVEKDLNDLALAATSQQGFADLISNPLLTRAQQEQIMAAIADSFKAHKITRDFVMTLASAKRLALLPEVARQLTAKAEQARGEVSAQLITATPIGKDEQAMVAERLGKAYGKTVKLTSIHDPKLLGGAVVKIGGMQLDASLAGKLQRLENTLKAA